MNGTLTDQERDILTFERSWWKYAGAKEQAIRDQFGITGTRYYQILTRLTDDPAAVAYDPQLVHRLQRLRRARQTRRKPRGMG